MESTMELVVLFRVCGLRFTGSGLIGVEVWVSSWEVIAGTVPEIGGSVRDQGRKNQTRHLRVSRGGSRMYCFGDLESQNEFQGGLEHRLYCLT